MHGNEFRSLREKMGLDRLAMARMIGYTGTDRNDVMRIRRLENSGEPVPLYIARLVWLIDEYSEVQGWRPHFPDWPGYEFDHTPDPQHQEQDNA